MITFPNPGPPLLLVKLANFCSSKQDSFLVSRCLFTIHAAANTDCPLGIVYFITIWYRHNERAVRIALVVAFCNLAGAFGGAIAYGIGHVNGSAGLEGFRWLFIIEGIITVLSAIPVWLCLPDYPARAKWLNESDKRFAEDRLKERGGGYNKDHASRKEIVETFFLPRMLAHYLAYVSFKPRTLNLHVILTI